MTVTSALSLILAGFAELRLPGHGAFRTLIAWPYAVAGAVTGIVFQMLFSAITGPLRLLNALWPNAWMPANHPTESMLIIVLAFTWNQLPLNFLLFSAALKSIPREYPEAGSIDGAGPFRRLFDSSCWRRSEKKASS